MSEDVWWARRSMSFVDLFRSKDAAQNFAYPLKSLRLSDWERLDGGEIKDGEIIPIRPLRIERFEVVE